MKKFAVIQNGIVVNAIIADDEFIEQYRKDTGLECVEYQEENEDDTKVARIGELYIDGLFVSEDQAIEMGLIDAE